ncbi:TrmH family RNA methyltransferase [Carboxylicivirga sp. N1Y90]|uniref:TrmH family RNA methyltransferase n=1 Tax=Carboxylicivirga fragile TaxID=3417571 RepID=UPI003D328B8E|nr:TrmH family RNA methyltransferase [Marinilabiliaceae bacterium N1Y90]
METHSKYFFEKQKDKTIDVGPILIADSFSTPENVGSIIRLAANVGAKKVIVLNGEHLRDTKVKKTAGAALNHVEVIFTDSNSFKEQLPNDYQICALETVEGAQSIYNCCIPSKLALVLGNEKYGVSDEMLAECVSSYYVPMPGAIKSMNVSHAATVCLFEWYRQQLI